MVEFKAYLAVKVVAKLIRGVGRFSQFMLRASQISKGCLISEIFSCCLQSPQQSTENYSELYLLTKWEDAQNSFWAHFLGDWSQSQNTL